MRVHPGPYGVKSSEVLRPVLNVSRDIDVALVLLDALLLLFLLLFLGPHATQQTALALRDPASL